MSMPRAGSLFSQLCRVPGAAGTQLCSLSRVRRENAIDKRGKLQTASSASLSSSGDRDWILGWVLPDPQRGQATGATAWLLGLPGLLKPSSFSLFTSYPWLLRCGGCETQRPVTATAGKARLCCRGDRGHSAGTLANQATLTARVTEPLCLPVVGFSRLSASSEMAPVVMVFFSLETPEAAAAAAPGFVSMSSLLARFSWDTEGGTGQDPEYSHQLVQNARFPC